MNGSSRISELSVVDCGGIIRLQDRYNASEEDRIQVVTCMKLTHRQSFGGAVA
jgi:hypothetical protein